MQYFTYVVNFNKGLYGYFTTFLQDSMMIL